MYKIANCFIILILTLPGSFLPAYCQDVNPFVQEKGTPFTYLLDTGVAIPFSPEQMAEKKGWTLVPEDDTTHSFQGDAVFFNDKLAVLIRKGGDAVEIYSLLTNPPSRRAAMAPTDSSSEMKWTLSDFSIEENTTSVVRMNAVFSGLSRQVIVGIRLTTGENLLEIYPGRGCNNIRVRANFRYVILPDFFGDDMVFSGDSLDRETVYLPAEKFILGALDNQDSLLMCVWQSNKGTIQMQSVRQEAGRKIQSISIDANEGQTIGLAFLEQPGIWNFHAAEPSPLNPTPSWTSPFPAKWRVDVLREEGQAESHPYSMEFPGNNNGLSYLVYPVDRDLNTPLSIYCPVDIMKNTLGVGPCQYILETEKLTSKSQLTPDQAADWIEKQFRRRKAGADRAPMEETLSAMNEIIRQTQARIQQYTTFTMDIKNQCNHEIQSKSQAAEVAAQLLKSVETVQKSLHTRPDSESLPKLAEQQSSRILQLIGKDNGTGECKSACAELRSLGEEQNYQLSKYRMLFRWLRQQCRMEGEDHPAARDFLNTLLTQTGKILGIE